MSVLLRSLSPLAHPIGFAWLMLILASLVSLRRRRWPDAAVCGVAALLFWCLGQGPISGRLCRGLETPWVQHTVEQAPSADAVIVLGGGYRASRPEYRHVDLTDAADRVFAGAELCRLGRAPTLVLGGDPPGSAPGSRTLSDEVRRWAREWGLATNEILTLGPVLSTRDEAVSAAELTRQRGWKKVLLVTSAFHMRRALDTFEKVGVPVHPVACDFRFVLYGLEDSQWRLCPNDESVYAFGLWWHEQLGWLVYRLFGHL